MKRQFWYCERCRVYGVVRYDPSRENHASLAQKLGHNHGEEFRLLNDQYPDAQKIIQTVLDVVEQYTPATT